MTTALVPTGPPAIPDLIRAFLDGRSPHTLVAYGRDLDDFARFLTGSRQEALGRFFAQPASAANGDVLGYRNALVARHLAPATINRRMAAVPIPDEARAAARCRTVGHRGPGRAPGDAQRHPRAGGGDGR